MDKIYNKLVRDKIPEIITDTGEEPIFRILSDKEYKVELEKKLLEECNEAIASSCAEERLKELADVLEVLISLTSLENKALPDIMEIAAVKKAERGGFEKKVFLEGTIAAK